MNKLIYFATNWPRSNTSAACDRVFGLVEVARLAYLDIDFICAANKFRENENGIKRYSFVKASTIDPNDNEKMSVYLEKTKNKIEAAMFDTFIAEEFYSHFIYKHFPKTLRVLDTQDLHSLRKSREHKFLSLREKYKHFKNVNLMEILQVKPKLEDTIHAREMASIFRSDVVFVTSDYEKFFLESNYGLKNIIKTQFYLSDYQFAHEEETYRTYFLDCEENMLNKRYNFDKRKNFAWIGSFKHSPNVNAVELLINEIWPEIHKILPEAELHIYGSDFPKIFEDIEKNGIKKKNLMADLKSLSRYRVLLAPLFFGAGIKGKITDSWNNFLPVVTTAIGAEGLFYESVDNDFHLSRVNDEQMSDRRFIKPEVEILKNENKELKEYYKYENEEVVKNSKFKFGGSYKSMSILIRLHRVRAKRNRNVH